MNNSYEYKKAIGYTIKKIRRKHNIKQEELAIKLGLTKSTISRYESGKVNVPSFILPKICDFCNSSLKEFMKILTEKKLDNTDELYKEFFNLLEYNNRCDSNYYINNNSKIIYEDYFIKNVKLPYNMQFPDFMSFNNSFSLQ